MRGNKLAMFFCVFLFVMLGSVFVFAFNQKYSNVQVFVEDVHPDVIHAGDRFDVYLRILNDGTDSIVLKNVNISLPKGFIVISRDPLNISTTLCGGCSLQTHYLIKAGTNVLPGMYPIEYDVYTKYYTLKKTYPIEIKGDEDILFNVLSSYGEINGNGVLKIGIENIGDVNLKDIKLFINDPFVKIANASFVYLPSLNKGDTKIISIPLAVSKEAQEGIRSIILNVSYRGNNIHYKQYAIPVHIEPHVEIYISSISLVDKPVVGKDVGLLIRVENDGYGKAKDIRVRIAGNFDAIQKESYLGELDSGEDSSAIFTITPLSRKNNVHYVVSYVEGNKTHTFEGDFEFTASLQNNTFALIILGFIVVVILVISYFKFIKKKR